MLINQEMATVLQLLNLDPSNKAASGRSNVALDCPFCGKKGKLSVNVQKGVWRCFRASCLAHDGGTSFDLYALNVFGAKYNDLAESEQKEVKDAIHGTDAYVPKKRKFVKKEASSLPTIASDSALHKVYAELLKLLPLTKEDEEELLERGLNNEQIERNRYRSMTLSDKIKNSSEFKSIQNSTSAKREIATALGREPKERDIQKVALGLILAARLKKNGLTDDDFVNVPGFYKVLGHWCLRVITGMWIPVRSISGEIVGICIHDKTRKAKYMALSSRDFPCGTAAVARMHSPLNNLIAMRKPYFRRNRIVNVTEGVLKADVAVALMGDKLRVPIWGVQGVDNLSEVPKYAKSLRVREVRNAFDMDKILKVGVYKAGKKLKSLLEEIDVVCKMMYWDRAFAIKKASELVQFCEEHQIKLPSKLGALDFIVAGPTEQDLWSMSALYASAIQQQREVPIPDDLLSWRKDTKGLDDQLLAWSKKVESDFYIA